MINKFFLGSCIIAGAIMVGGCSGNKKSAEDSAAGSVNDSTSVEYLRLNCKLNVDGVHASQAIELAQQLVVASMSDEGVMDYDMYESATHPGQFVIYETWKDQSSLDAHSASSHFTTLVPQIQAIAPITVEVFEKRTENEVSDKQIRINCMFVAKEGMEEDLLATAKELVAATQSDSGMIDYDIYTSITRPGHYMIFETWKDQPSLDAHSAASHFITLVPRIRDFAATTTTDIFYF